MNWNEITLWDTGSSNPANKNKGIRENAGKVFKRPGGKRERIMRELHISFGHLEIDKLEIFYDQLWVDVPQEH